MPLPLDTVFCPHCGFQVRSATPDPVDVHTKDFLLSVLMAVLTLFVTLPMNWLALGSLLLRGTGWLNAAGLFLVAIWNGYFIGLPLMIITRRWYVRVQRGEFYHAWMWRDY
ncbi:MAG TPA: hypothetical protein VFG20_14005 [Planctomycetaceae bacterium]|nr:hypothetical protein [Planctomycetaceae bacterium]